MAESWRHVADVAVLLRARAAALLGEHLFTVDHGGKLWRVGVDGGAVEPFYENDWEIRLVTAAGGRVYAFGENGMLFALEPEGDWERLDGDWSSVRAACGMNGEVFVFSGEGNLYVLEPNGAGWHQLGDAALAPRLLIGDGESLFALEESGGLYRIDVRDGSWQQLDGVWDDVCCGAATSRGLLLATESGSAYAVGRDGFWPLEEGAPAGARFLFASGSDLLAATPGGALHALRLS